jgi:hypothetical protein
MSPPRGESREAACRLSTVKHAKPPLFFLPAYFRVIFARLSFVLACSSFVFERSIFVFERLSLVPSGQYVGRKIDRNQFSACRQVRYVKIITFRT